MKGKSGIIRPKRNRSVNMLVPTVAMMKTVLERHLRPHGLVFDIPISELSHLQLQREDDDFDDDERLIGCRPELNGRKEFRGNRKLKVYYTW